LSPANDAPVFSAFPIPGVPPCPGVVAHIVREQVMTADAKSKAAANLLTFRFIDIFLLVLFLHLNVCLRCVVSEFRDEVPKKIRQD
jgi:hypothetical protein